MDRSQQNFSSSNRIIDKYIKPEIPYLSKRYTIAILICLGFIISTGTQINIPTVSYYKNNKPVFLTNATTFPILQCNKNNRNNFKLFEVLQSLYWIYLQLISHITGGILSYMYPAQKVFGIAIALKTVLNFLYALPLEDCVVFEVTRLFQEFFHYVAYAAIIGIWRHWAPLQDRSRLLAISYCGNLVGLFISKYLIEIAVNMINEVTHFLIYGIIGIFWFVIWMWLIFEKPRDHPSISKAELIYIESSIINANCTAPSITNVPWKKMFTSKPVYALLIIYSCQISNYVQFSKTYEIPYNKLLFFKNMNIIKVLNLNLFISAAMMLFVGCLADVVRKHSSLSTTNIRKLFITFFVTGVCLFNYYNIFMRGYVNYWSLSFNKSFELMFNINCLDVVPMYSTLMMSISSTIILIKISILNKIMSLNYYDYFFIKIWMISVYLTSIVFYLKLGSSEEEHWSEESNANDHLAYKNTLFTLQEFLANTNAIEMKQSNEQTNVENTSSRTRILYRIINKYIEIPYLSKRYIVAILTWFGFIISFGAQTKTPNIANVIADDFIHECSQFNLNQNQSTYIKLYECKKVILNDTENKDFDFSNLNDVYWNLFGQIIGGLLAYKYPAQRVFGISIALQTVFNFFLVIPFENFIQFKAIRKLQETLQFVAYVACIGILRHWAPLQERPYLLAISYCGPHVGLFIGRYLVQNVWIMSNCIAHLLIYGMIGLLWFAFWTWLIFEKPRVHPSISEEELNYIESSLGTDHSTNATSLVNIPWKKMFTSKPVYALIIVYSCKESDYCHSLSIFKNTFSRKFQNDLTNMGINSNLILSSILMLYGGFITYIIQEYFNVSTTNTRKLFISVDILLESLFALYYFQKKIFRGFMVLSFDGVFNLMFIISCLDLHPKYATILMSFSSAMNVVKYYLLSIKVSFTDFQRNENKGVFFFVWLTFLQFIGVMCYLKSASSVKQHWSEESNVTDSRTSVNKPVYLQENLSNTIANNIMNNDNTAPRIQNASDRNSFDHSPSRFIDKYIKPELPVLSKRYTLAILIFFGFVFVYAMQCTMHNVSLEQINYIHKRSFDMFNNEPNASLENANNDYNALLEVFNYVHNNSLEKKINIMYNKTEQVNYVFNQSLEEKLNQKYNRSLEKIYQTYNEKNEQIDHECNEKIEKTNHEYDMSLEKFNHTYNKSIEEKFECIYNKSLENFNQEYNDQLREIYYEYNTALNETKNYMFEKVLKKDCDQKFSELVQEIKMYRVHILHANANKIAELVKLNCKKSYWEKDFLAFVFGNALAQIPGGVLAYLYPAHKVFGAAIGLSSIIHLCTTIIYDEISSKYAILFLQGLVQGVMYPACHGIWRHWAPPFERSRLSTISFSGIFVGIVIGIPLTNVLKDSLGWKMPFYTYGIAGLLWYNVWTWLSFEKPSHHPVISTKERDYIRNSFGSSNDLIIPSLFKYIPWKQMVTSKSVIAIIVADFCHMWSSIYILLILAEEINLPISTKQFYIIIPFLFASIIILSGGVIADYLIRKSILCTTNVRKVFTCGGFTVEAFIILLSAFSSWTEVERTHICLIFSMTFSGLAFSGFNVNHLDIAPRYASILLGITNSISLIAVIVLFPFVTYIMEMPKSLQQGIDIFPLLAFVTMCLQFVGDVFYSSCASGEQQPWAEPVFNENMSTDIPKANIERKFPPRGFRLLL